MEALAGEGDDDLAKLEFHEGDGNFGGGKAGGADEFIDRSIGSAEGFEDEVFFVGEVGVVFDGRGFWFGILRDRKGEVGEVVEDLGAVGDEGGSVADEIVAAAGGGSVDGAWDGVDGAAGFVGHVGGDEGAGAAGAFDDEEGAGPVGDDAVSLGEGLFVGFCLEGELGDDGSESACNFFGEGEILGRINLHEARAEDADGTAFGGDGTFVGGGVDAAGKTRDDGESGAGELVGELAGDFASVVGELARANDADGVKVALHERSPDVEDDGRVIHVAEGGGVVGIFLGEDLNVALAGQGEFGGGIAIILPGGDDFGGFGSDALGLLQSGVCLFESSDTGAKTLEESPDFDRANLRELVESDEGFGFSHGRSIWRVVRGKGIGGNR